MRSVLWASFFEFLLNYFCLDFYFSEIFFQSSKYRVFFVWKSPFADALLFFPTFSVCFFLTAGVSSMICVGSSKFGISHDFCNSFCMCSSNPGAGPGYPGDSDFVLRLEVRLFGATHKDRIQKCANNLAYFTFLGISFGGCSFRFCSKILFESSKISHSA